MDEQSTHGEDELNLATDADDVADTAATDTDGQETDSKDEQEHDTLNLEEESTPKEKGKAEVAKEEQAEAWVKKIKSGEKTLDDLPANLRWLKPSVEAKLDVKQKEVDQDMIRKILIEEKQEDKFQSLKNDLEAMSLSRDKKESLQEKFKSLRAKGLSKLDSLEITMEALGINPEEDRLDARRKAMRLRTPGNYKKTSNLSPSELHKEAGYGEVAKSLPEEKRLEYLKSLRKGRR